ncbi:hypothetical protein LJC38_06980 [Parabacteroides sp. OttesenSCG-928-K15]|nr:hypothetical protein [Parabacteroides sp. OttesenSCG-928-K15]
MKKNLNYLAMGALCLPLACTTPQEPDWKEQLKGEIPLMGHRNWIVITDMAYPLQTQPGIETIYVDEPYMDILSFVYEEIEKAPHVRPHIYQDKELSFLSDQDAKGVDALKEKMNTLMGSKVIALPHEELIGRLDEVSKMFHVIILKSNLTIPYTSTFFELDCNYWEDAKQQLLQKRMENQ